MVNRTSIYDSFVKYVDTNLTILNNKREYYLDRIEISNNKLNIFRDSLERNAEAVKLIYGIDIDNIDINYSKIVSCNKVTINKHRSSLLQVLKSVNTNYGESVILLVQSLTENYFTIKNEIKYLNRQVKILDDKLYFLNKYKGLSKNIVYYIISKCNKYYSDALLEGETIHLGHHIGMIKVVPKKVNGKINWNESFKFRDRLLAEGKIPYKRSDYIKAKQSGSKYNGIQWFIYYENEVQHYINWYAYSNKLPNKDAYHFVPARFNKSNKTISEIRNELSKVSDLDNYKIGIVNKLNLALDINEMQFVKYMKDDI